MKTLYISDLDGTLLTPDACLSERSTQLLQQLSAEGVLFSCATARSIVSVRRCCRCCRRGRSSRPP